MSSAKLAKSVGVVALGTLGSRLLGLLRDVLTLAALGAGAVGSAFVLAFTLPNLFRRLLGEGALTSALLPVLTEALTRDGRPAAFALLNRVVARLTVWLVGLTAVVAAVLVGVGLWPGLEARYTLGAWYGLALFPYVVLVCVAALYAAALNSLGRFAVAAVSQVWINLAIIGAALLGGWVAGADAEARGWWLAGGVLVGGIVQVLAAQIALGREGWRPHWDLSRHPQVDEVWRLLLPGLVGAAIFQINVAVTRFLGFVLDDTATSYLYLAARLMELPLGLFAVSIITVYFPQLAALAAQGKMAELGQRAQQAMRVVWAINLPAAVGLALLAEPIVVVLFQWGKFDAGAAQGAAPVVAMAAAAMPFFGISALLTRLFHSVKDTRTPVRVAGLNLVVNLGAGAGLMLPFGVVGLAAGNLLAGIVHSVALGRLLGQHHAGVGAVFAPGPMLKVVVAAAAMGAVVGTGHAFWPHLGTTLAFVANEPKLLAAAELVVLIPAGVASYSLALWLLRASELTDVLALVRRRLDRRRPKDTAA